MIFFVALGLWGASGVTNRWRNTQKWWRGRTHKKDLAFDGLRGAVFLYSHAKNVFAKLCYINYIFGRSRAQRGAPGVTGRWCSTLGGWRVRMNQNNEIFHDFRGQFPSLPMKKMTMPNLLISMAFLVALGLLGGPLGWRMGDMLPQDNVRVGQIRNTYTMMAFLKLLPDLLMKKRAQPNLVILVVFLVVLGLWEGPLGWRVGDAPPQEGDRLGNIIKNHVLPIFGHTFTMNGKQG